MTAAIALAIVLAIAVAGAAVAMESQHGSEASAGGPSTKRTPRPPRMPSPPTVSRRPRSKDRPAGSTPDPVAADGPPPPSADPEPEVKIPDILRTGATAEAKVISVVDERTLGPVTRSRLNLRIEPAEGRPFEVTVRWAFQTPEARSKVRVGGTVPVRYDPDDTNRVVVDLPQD